MEKDTVDDLLHDTSTRGKVIGNDGSPHGDITINESNQDDYDDSLQTLSDLSLTNEPYDELEDDHCHNQNYLNNFFKVPPSLSGCPGVPEIKRNRYLFPYKNDTDGTDIDNISRETENEYVIMKYNCKELQEMCDNHPDYEDLLTRKIHEWNWYC
eukprot:5596840-Ditylum_brightwellii.AAC.1